MKLVVGTRRARYELVTGAHHFLIAVLPLRDPESADALAAFVDHASTCRLPSGDLEVVLLQCLRVIAAHAGAGEWPLIVNEYLASSSDDDRSVSRFQRCVEGVLRRRTASDPAIQKAIEIVENRYGDPEIKQSAIAAAVHLRPAPFASRFKARTGATFGKYLRKLRLTRAAAIFMADRRTIKEVWVQVGYNHPSNFDHDFKRQFGVTPRDYRNRVSHRMAECPPDEEAVSSDVPQPAPSCVGRSTVLIIDDDLGTRETLSRYFRLEGYQVCVAANGSDGLLQADRVEPQSIVLDFHLPDFDALTYLRALRARRPASSQTPNVVVFTADWEVELASDELRTLGAKFASKLCDLEDLLKLIAA